MPNPSTPSHIELIARALIHHPSPEHRDHILLCRNIKHNYTYLPGGHIEPGESATTALQRELIEECNFHLPPPPQTTYTLLTTIENRFTDHKGRPHHEINLVFRVEMFHVEHGESPEPNHQPQPSPPPHPTPYSPIATPSTTSPPSQPHSQSPSTTNQPSKTPPEPPTSLEPDIDFLWASPQTLKSIDLRPSILTEYLSPHPSTHPSTHPSCLTAQQTHHATTQPPHQTQHTPTFSSSPPQSTPQPAAQEIAPFPTWITIPPH